MASANTTSARTAKPRKAARPKRQTSTNTSASAATKNASVAERAVLIPVGAALIAREKVVTGVNDTISSYSSTSRAQAQLRKFERRGNTARKRVEREVRKARTSVERELRRRRHDGADLADRLQGRIQSLV